MEQTEKINPAAMETLQKMVEAGVHIGHKKAKGHPKMKPFLFGIRQGVQIINVEKTLEKLEEAAEFLKKTAAKGGVIIFVATRVPGKLLIQKAATDAGSLYVVERWIGGTLTNFPNLSKRLQYFLEQEEKKGKGELVKYSKKEQLLMSREIETLEKKMGGIKTLKKKPDALVVIDIDEHLSAVREATKMGVPVVAITDTNTNPTLVAYPIPANDKSVKSLTMILDRLVSAVKEGKAEIRQPAEVTTEKQVQA
ncbi:MAG: 30S ribosomal protein S2 [Candidatus Azambacteria bacterium]|nr:30S ribosomal protein S2 [Candidatus Azambacteria bacterium]